ncbi:hypothetical protein B6J19_05115 [Klebsiella quasipneumoniae]|uniref:hypothetical protein n=1 Tax=Raoultella TaxID=160674 RepID=UPI000BA1E51A|nr:hypothetical protein [Raoultella ornithinolytica]MDM9660365.1 hypothetical protein [Raoultella planticola]OZZ64831.1 hypothetical protein CDA25_04170 [Klebsiella pneumoniae]PLG93176.1 hypothetical protein B6J19_05115 [Klebsiella quasipneumoniae]MDM9665503.1 hypothetical protein [Raoultella planticola]QQO48188.1 hypothetical protein HQH16_07375 [Raoultella ornithinolytica]
MRLNLLGVGNAPLLSMKVKTLDEGLINVSALCRTLNVKRSTFLSKVANVGLEAAILHYVSQQKLKGLK